MDAYKARSDALAKANEGALVMNALVNIMTFIFVCAGAVVVWLNPSVRWLLALTFSVLFVRFIVKSVVSHVWAMPKMRQIDKDFPAPSPRTKDMYKS